MRKSTLGVLTLLTLAIGYRALTTIIAQNSGPFETYAIKNTTQAEINEKLGKIETDVGNMQSGRVFKRYAENIRFSCIQYDYSQEISNRAKIRIRPKAYITCQYIYGFFGGKIAIHVYLNEKDEIIHAQTANLYSEY